MGEGFGGGLASAESRVSRGKAPICWRQGGLGAEPLALGDFCNFFNKNNAFYAYFG